MIERTLAFVLIAFVLIGCGIGRVVTAPVRYVFSEPEHGSAANNSDVTNPGHPVAVPSPTPTPRVASRKSGSTRKTSEVASTKPSTKSSAPPKSSTAAKFPVAKPVPGKAGLVFNPFNANGGYIDVSGYAPGSKVKDPDSQQIFIVP
jgi:hypothetical protein